MNRFFHSEWFIDLFFQHHQHFATFDIYFFVQLCWEKNKSHFFQWLIHLRWLRLVVMIHTLNRWNTIDNLLILPKCLTLFSYSRIRSSVLDLSLAFPTVSALSNERQREKLMNNIIWIDVCCLHEPNSEKAWFPFSSLTHKNFDATDVFLNSFHSSTELSSI